MAKLSLPTSSSVLYLSNFAILLAFCLSTTCIQYAQGSSHFGENCAKNTDCEDTEFCHENLCSCKSIPNRLYSKYNSEKKICESLVDSVCSKVAEKDGRKVWPCVENADCIQKPGKLPLTLGLCECKTGYFSRDGICGHFQKTVQDFQTKSRDDQATVPWVKSESTNLHQSPIIFYLTVILPYMIWLPS